MWSQIGSNEIRGKNRVWVNAFFVIIFGKQNMCYYALCIPEMFNSF